MTQDEFKKIISTAIKGEDEAYKYYSAVSEKVEDKNIKDLFNGLAEDEKKHGITLEAFLARSPESMHFSESQDYKTVDALPTPPLTMDLKPVEGPSVRI